MIFKTLTKATLGAALFLGAMSSQALVINSIDMEVRSFDYINFGSDPTTVTEAKSKFSALTHVVCTTSINSFDNVGSFQSCNGPKNNVATLFTVDVQSDGETFWKWGADYGLASVIFTGNDTEINSDSTDLWWGYNWNHGDVVDFSTGAGSYTLSFLGFEHCCGGGMSLRYDDKDGQGFRTASVPEPGSLALLGLGLIGLVISRRKLKS